MKFEPILPNENDQEDSFEPLRFQQRVFAAGDKTRYRIYKDNSEFVVIEAISASEAFNQSGVSNPLRIVSESVLMAQNVVDGAMLITREQHQERRNASLASAAGQVAAATVHSHASNGAFALPQSDIADNPNFMPNANGALPEIEPLVDLASSNKQEAELSPDEVKRLLGDKPV